MVDGNGVDKAEQQVAEHRPQKTPIALAPGGLRPINLDELWRMAQMFAGSELVPKDYKDKPGNVAVAIELGMELGVPPMQAVQNIAVINGRGSVYGDLGLALVVSHPGFESITEMDHVDIVAQDKAVCSIQRRGWPLVTRTYTKAMAKAAGLLGKQGPWTTAEPRMMQMRARWFAMRDTFADALKGMGGVEEREDDVDIVERNITPRGPIAMPKALPAAEPATVIEAKEEKPETVAVITPQAAVKADEQTGLAAKAEAPVVVLPPPSPVVTDAKQEVPPPARADVAAGEPSLFAQPAQTAAPVVQPTQAATPAMQPHSTQPTATSTAETLAWKDEYANDPTLVTPMKLQGKAIKTAGATIVTFAKLRAECQKFDTHFKTPGQWQEAATILFGTPMVSIFHCDENRAKMLTQYLRDSGQPAK